MKVKAQILMLIEGSDDPRAIQGGGGDVWRVLDTRIVSPWLIKAYVKALNKLYDEQFDYKIVA